MPPTDEELVRPFAVHHWFIKHEVAANDFYYPKTIERSLDPSNDPSGVLYDQSPKLQFRLVSSSGGVYAVQINSTEYVNNYNEEPWSSFNAISNQTGSGEYEQEIEWPYTTPQGQTVTVRLKIRITSPEPTSDNPYGIELYKFDNGDWVAVGHSH